MGQLVPLPPPCALDLEPSASLAFPHPGLADITHTPATNMWLPRPCSPGLRHLGGSPSLFLQAASVRAAAAEPCSESFQWDVGADPQGTTASSPLRYLGRWITPSTQLKTESRGSCRRQPPSSAPTRPPPACPAGPTSGWGAASGTCLGCFQKSWQGVVIPARYPPSEH